MVHHHSLYAAPWDAPIKPDYYTFRPPLYGLLIALIKGFYNSDYAILLVQAGISLSTIWGVKHWLKQLNIDAEVALIFILIAYPSQIIHCNFVMSDILFQALLFWSFYYCYKLYQTPSLKIAFVLVLFFLLAMLAKPVAYLMGISAGIIFSLLWFKQKRLHLLIPFVLLPLLYHAYASYNQKVTGHYHYSTVTPIFVLKYMGKYTNAQVYGEAYADSVQENIMRQTDTMNLSQRYHWMNEQGKAMIAKHPLRFAMFNVKGWFAFMLDPGRFEWVHFLNLPEGNFLGLYHVLNTQGIIKGGWYWLSNAPIGLILLLALCFSFNLLLSYYFLRFLFEPKVPLALRICLFLFVGYIIGATGVLGLSRYRIAVAPLLWIAALVWQHKTKRHD
jgi:hypothetical protein